MERIKRLKTKQKEILEKFKFNKDLLDNFQNQMAIIAIEECRDRLSWKRDEIEGQIYEKEWDEEKLKEQSSLLTEMIILLKEDLIDEFSSSSTTLDK